MLDGLSTLYAADENNNKKAANEARKIAYMEGLDDYEDLLYKPKEEKATASTLLYKPTDEQKQPVLLSNNMGEPTREDFSSDRAYEEYTQHKSRTDPRRYVGETPTYMHKAPGTEYTAINKLNSGTEVTYTGNKVRDKNGEFWAEIECKGQRGWVVANDLRVTNPNPQKTKPVSVQDETDTTIPLSESTVYYGHIDIGEKNGDLNQGDLTKEQLRELDGISLIDFANTEKTHIANWKFLAQLTSKGKMQDVVMEMIDHFLDGSGTDYTNEHLTKVVSEHKNTQAYMNDFSEVFKQFLQDNNGDYSAFANSGDFKDALENENVLLSKYSLDGWDSLLGGEYMAIHSWTDSIVEVKSLEVLPDGSYTGVLHFTFSDNFGLDSIDVKQFQLLAGFRSWYILQHYDKYKDKYKPFKTIVEIDYPISGNL